MATRNPKRMALYEAIQRGETGIRGGASGAEEGLEKLREHHVEDASAPLVDSQAGRQEKLVARLLQQWSARPGGGRGCFLMSYRTAGVIFLVFAAIVVAAFVLGRTYGPADKMSEPVSGGFQAVRRVEEKALTDNETRGSRGRGVAKSTAESVAGAGEGTNVIVIAICDAERDLEPVQKYFADNGIETIIEKDGSRYILITKQRYENPHKQGTDGYLARQKIKETGVGYTAPAGYKGFGLEPFQDAYGKKVE